VDNDEEAEDDTGWIYDEYGLRSGTERGCGFDAASRDLNPLSRHQIMICSTVGAYCISPLNLNQDEWDKRMDLDKEMIQGVASTPLSRHLNPLSRHLKKI